MTSSARVTAEARSRDDEEAIYREELRYWIEQVRAEREAENAA